MMGRKILYLVAALALPVAIFLFLKFFGRNEFSVEPLFQQSVPSTECAYRYELPYVVPDSVQALVPGGAELAVVIVPDDAGPEDAQGLVRRLKSLFSDDPVYFHTVERSMKDGEYGVLRECVFLLPKHTAVALLDRQGRIRGQYDAASMEEVDRLIVEMKIILRKF